MGTIVSCVCMLALISKKRVSQGLSIVGIMTLWGLARAL